MDLIIAAVGTRMPNWVDEAFAEYQKRMPREARIRLMEIKPDKRDGGKTAQQVMSVEAMRIEDALPKDCLRIVLDEHGKSFTSQALAQEMQKWLGAGRDAALIIGGADGLAPEIKSRADLLWSLSPLTLPHGMVRVLLAEQLYRAHSILHNHPYHRE
ncbi:MAG: 23S rRNA (pseudouridine(1915)-N(3))-methyltransferase RlmH [Burkholderiales bacterium]|nr:23S rRNA (pseudouridine(1915)-N(3))-methyltransferase RlmH [Burkholderiales bacterium]